jgi:hypothetical protein
VKVGDLVRFHGGILSTAPIAIVIGWKPATRIENFEQLKIVWTNGPQCGKAGWMPAHTLEKVLLSESR